MVLIALSFLAGVSLVQLQARLPSLPTMLLSLLLIGGLCLLAARSRSIVLRRLFLGLVFLLVGIGWATLRAQHYLDHRLPETLAGKDIEVTGLVTGIPTRNEGVQRFNLQLTTIGIDAAAVTAAPEKLRLSWYHGETVNAGERWSLLVRLKPPHGFFNAGGFDYEGWLYQQDVHATGYVRKSSTNRKIADPGPFSLDAVRQKLSRSIQRMLGDRELAGLVPALAVGDRSAIRQDHWQQLINTGTNHLMAISGLHIGLAAGFGYWLVRRLAPTAVIKAVSAQRAAVCSGLLVALVYALLAGLSIPTQRALLMLACFALALWMKRNFVSADALAIAMLMILLWHPVSVLSAGFWFSFLAVAVIFYVFAGRHGATPVWKQWGWMQFAIALALFPLSLLLFQQTSLVSPLANFILVPYVSFLVVPLVLLSVVLLPVSELVSSWLLLSSADLLAYIWPVIDYLSASRFAYWRAPGAGIGETLLAMTGVILLLAPAGVPARWLGLLMLLPVVYQAPERPHGGDFVLDLLDVGQGLSALVRTENHALLYDTGAKFSSRLDAGKDVVLPFLRDRGIEHLDRVIISHGDADHIGGADSVLAAYPNSKLIGQDIEALSVADKQRCLKPAKWHWDGVDFEVLHPGARAYPRRNNRSCVLKISAVGGRLLFTGDIESRIEKQLVNEYGDELAAEVLVVPHHGSKTSSSQAFIDAVSPELALFPLGYRNRYRFPDSGVSRRYLESGAKLRSSGHSGAIRVVFEAGGGVAVVDEYRNSHARYWNHRPAALWR